MPSANSKLTGPWWTPWRKVSGTTVLHVDLSADENRESRAAALLDKTETARLNRFLSARARREFALCRAALRISLSERLGCPAHQISFDLLRHGKPVAKVAGATVNLEFNVSHSGRHGLIAVSEHAAVGIDVEETVSQRDFEGIGSMVFSSA